MENSTCFESEHIPPIVLILYNTVIGVFDLRKGWAYSGVFKMSD